MSVSFNAPHCSLRRVDDHLPLAGQHTRGNHVPLDAYAKPDAKNSNTEHHQAATEPTDECVHEPPVIRDKLVASERAASSSARLPSEFPGWR